MPALTSTQAGLLSNSATWGGTTFADGDTLTVRHAVVVDVAATIGDSPPAATTVLAIDHSGAYLGALQIAPGIRLTLEGDCTLKDATLTLEAGAGLRFDSSGAAGTPIYKLNTNITNSNPGTLKCNGTSAAHCAIDIAPGSGVGKIGENNDTGGKSSIDSDFTDYTDIGNASTHIVCRPSDAALKFRLHDCTFTNCGKLYSYNVALTGNFDLRRNRWITVAAGSASTDLQSVAGVATGQRIFHDNVLALTNQDTVALFDLGRSNWDIQRNVFGRVVLGSGATYAANPVAQFKDNLIYTRAANNSHSFIGQVSDTLSRLYFIYDQTANYSICMGPNTVSGNGTLTWDGYISECTNPALAYAGSHLGDANTGYSFLHAFRHALVLPGPAGAASGTFYGRGNRDATRRVDMSFEHCTLMATNGISGGGGVQLGNATAYHAAQLPACRSNLVWAKAVETYPGFLVDLAVGFTGTATAGGANTLTDTARSWPTAAGSNLTNNQFSVVITAQRGAGPPIGEIRTIASNTTTQITVSVNWSATPDTGTDYRIGIADAATPAALDYNATYNSGDGTTYDATGQNGVTNHGYNRLWLSAAVGGHDVTLTPASNEMTAGPKFIDSSRNFATADIACFANPPGTAWATGQAYVIGDIVSCASSTFYSNATINYRCCTAHTSSTGHATNGKPGVAASYRTNWEFTTAYTIRQDTAKIATLYDWVMSGFQVQEAALNNAGHDGLTIGAADYYAPPPPPPPPATPSAPTRPSAVFDWPVNTERKQTIRHHFA